MEDRLEDAREKTKTLERLLKSGAGPDELFAAASKARLALEFRASDAMIGLGADADQDQALVWCKRAGEAGNARAMANLGGFYATGRGVGKDESLAVQWYEKAANAGHGKAAAILGVMFAAGQGAPVDRGRA